MPPTLSAQEFVAKWRQAKLKERSAAQEHFIDVCRLIGHATPAEADPGGASFVFEAGADKARGGHGWADVWKKGYFAWEYKGKHADLDRAYQQLLQYRESLLNPPLLIVS
ncbi:MAG: class I SAM-dependent DNA methyltransferase, partial [Anaerolineae bacterium]